VLSQYVNAPKLYLDERGQSKIDDVARELWRRLEETMEDNPEARLKYQAMRLGDNFGDGPLTVDDMQKDLFQSGENPF
jgi:hypothetical protein